jgi:predicted ATP-dependent endonuclease of OLD family
LQFSRPGASWIAAADCGLGLQDLLVLLYFACKQDIGLLCVEEPESHLHPDMQRRLLAFLKSMTDRQFLLSTHSNVFLDNAFVDRVYFTSFADSVTVTDTTSRASILDDLGYSVADNLVSDVVLLVEGPTDVPVLEELLLKTAVSPHYDVKIWPLGGDNMDQVDLRVLAQGYVVAALIDNDPGSRSVRERFSRNCEAAGISVHKLQRYAIENYFSLRALRSVFKSQIAADVQLIRPDESLESQIGINVKRNNRKLARAMDLAEVEGTDLAAFLDTVRSLCEQSAATRRSA